MCPTKCFPSHGRRAPPNGERFLSHGRRAPPNGERFPSHGRRAPPNGERFPNGGRLFLRWDKREKCFFLDCKNH